MIAAANGRRTTCELQNGRWKDYHEKTEDGLTITDPARTKSKGGKVARLQVAKKDKINKTVVLLP